MKNPAWSRTGRRLFAAFASLIAVYSAAAVFALVGLVEIQRGLVRTRERVEGLHVALDLASAVRDQYAHLAHTIIIGDASHLEFHADARGKVERLISDMNRFAADADEQTWVSEIRQATTDMDRVFRDRILPAVLAGRAETVQTEHHHVLATMDHIQENTDRLAGRFEESIAEIQGVVASLQNRTLAWFIVFLLIAPALAAWAGIAIGRSVARPIARLKAGAERIASGDLDTRIDIETRDDFGALAHQFNTMAASIKEHQQQQMQSEKLAGIGRLAAGVAHEINNPLGVILGYVRVMAKKAEGGLAEDLKIIEWETVRCKEIVDGLLDLTRPIKFDPEPVDLRELSDDVAARMGDSERADDIAISIDGKAAVEGNALKLRQVVFNLMKNAVEAVEPGGRVEVRIEQVGDHVELSVSDTGPGFDDRARSHLFEPFFTTKRQGTGLGLAVSQAIARSHGGDIVVDNPGSGARLIMLLPRSGKGGPR
jgi:signal transduction histidine kinase